MDRQVDAVRSFNRFYTRRIGALGDRHLDSPFSLTEMRVLTSSPTATRRPPPIWAAISASTPAI